MTEEQLNIAVPILHLASVVFTAWLLPRSLKELTFGPTIYLILNSLLWIGVALLIAYMEIGLPDGEETNLMGPLIMGFICFGVGLFRQMTPKYSYNKRARTQDDETS